MSRERPPHIIWFMCDQLRPDAVGFMGNSIVRTPNLDRLAEAGVVFEKMFVQASACMPSRASMITSRYVRNVRMDGGSPLMPPDYVTLPESLQEAGYGTALSGKLHITPQQYTAWTFGEYPVNDPARFLEAAGLPPMSSAPTRQRFGFQAEHPFEDMLQMAWTDWLETKDPALGAESRERNRRLFTSEFPETSLGDVGCREIPAELHPSSYIGETAAEYFAGHHAAQPLYLHVSFVDPHHPWDPPREIAAHYPPEEMPLPKYRDAGEVKWPPLLQERTTDFSDVTDAMARTTIAYYYAMMETLDMAVGRVLDAVEAAGEWEHTIFVFVADHGELLGDYGLWRKGSYHYDCMIQVPSFICAPGRLPGGRRTSDLMEAIDLTPTVLGLAGLPVHDGMQGRDVSAELVKGESVARPYVFCELHTTQWGPFVCIRTIRTTTAKLNYYPEERVGHLFDLEKDPDERHDVWEDPAYRPLRDEMMATLVGEMVRQADPLPKVLSQF